MSRKTLKMTLAGAFVACAFGGFAIGIAYATPGAGVTAVTIAGPVALDEININVAIDDDTHVKIKTKGAWVSRVVRYSILPGGHTGWHSHPGPVFVMVTAGTMTKYEANDPTTAIVYPAGTGFVEGVGDAHIAGNAGAVPLEFTAFFLTPAAAGNAIRINEPAPQP